MNNNIPVIAPKAILNPFGKLDGDIKPSIIPARISKMTHPPSICIAVLAALISVRFRVRTEGEIRAYPNLIPAPPAIKIMVSSI